MGGVPTRMQVSAGGVVFRRQEEAVEVALILVENRTRWQLPKGLVGEGEEAAAAAMREVREETGLHTEMVGPIDTIEYWYYSKHRGGRVRFHKYVHYYLLRYQSGDTADHDHEVDEARWVEIDRAAQMLTFANEKKVVAEAREIIERLESPAG